MDDWQTLSNEKRTLSNRYIYIRENVFQSQNSNYAAAIVVSYQ